MKEFRIFWNDFTETAKKELLDLGFEYDQNMEIYELTILSQEFTEEEDE